MTENKRKDKYAVLRIIEWIFVILMAVQIVLGLGWLFGNIGQEALFHESTLFLKAAESLTIDEYMGILYPLLIKGAEYIESFLGVPYYSLLYILQIVCGLLAAIHFVGRLFGIRGTASVDNKYLTVFVAGFIVTCPLLLQLHMAVLPYSLAASAMVYLIAEGIFYLRSTEPVTGTVLIRLCGVWLASAMLVPEYIVFIGIYMSGVFFALIRKNKQQCFRLLTAVLATVLCFGVISGSTQTTGSMGRIQRSGGAVMVTRFVWPYFVRNSFFWEETVKNTFSEEELIYFSQYPEAVIYEFGPKLEAACGREKANAIYWDMALTSIEVGTREIVTDISRDFAAYLCPQLALQIQMEHNTGSLNGWNYEMLRDAAPIVSKYYVRTALFCWNILSLSGILYLLLRKLAAAKESDGSGEKLWTCGTGLVLTTAVCVVLWYTMGSNGMQDYKNVMVITFLWMLPAVNVLMCIQKERKAGEDAYEDGRNR